MTDRARDIEILNELLAAEKRSVLPRLAEAAPHVSREEAAVAESIRRMVREEAAHTEWLVQAILALGGSPAPAAADLRTSNLHYLELGYLLSHAVRGKDRLVLAYDSAVGRIEDDDVRALVARIADRHRAHLEELRALATAPAT